MTDLEICIAIERVLGFEVELSCTQSGLDAVRNGERRPMMAYTADLNAMHEAEKALTSMQQDEYWDHLSDEEVDHLFATARQRAEAFLRTLGKWEE